MEFGRALDNLYVGECPGTCLDIDLLKNDLKVTAVLSVQTDRDIETEGVDWKALQEHYVRSGILLRRVPIRDFDHQELRDKLPATARALHDLIAAGHTVYVHCSMGWNRSPTLVIAYLHWHEKWTLEQATLHVRACKECDPAPYLIGE